MQRSSAVTTCQVQLHTCVLLVCSFTFTRFLYFRRFPISDSRLFRIRACPFSRMLVCSHAHVFASCPSRKFILSTNRMSARSQFSMFGFSHFRFCMFVVPMFAISKFRTIACFVFPQRRSFTCASFRRFAVRILRILSFPFLTILHVRVFSRLSSFAFLHVRSFVCSQVSLIQFCTTEFPHARIYTRAHLRTCAESIFQLQDVPHFRIVSSSHSRTTGGDATFLVNIDSS